MYRKVLGCLGVAMLVLGAGELGAQDPNYVLTISGGDVAPGGSINSTATLDILGTNNIQGWSYGVCHDTAALTLTGVVSTNFVDTLNGGGLPGFLNLNQSLVGGYTLGIVIDLFGVNTLAPGVGYQLTVASYDNLLPLGESADLCPCSTLGSPAVSTVVVVNGGSIPPITNCGTATSFVPPSIDHVRGDANDDSRLNIADGIWMLNDLFQGGPHSDCDGANDANASGTYDASDAIFIFNYQFLNGPAPSAPFPACGGDSDPSPEDCATYTSCP